MREQCLGDRGVASWRENKESGSDVPYAFCDIWRFRGDMLVALDAYVIRTAHAARVAAAGSSR